jgi:hypothetical protein
MTAVRALLIAAGVALGVYGAALLWDNPRHILIRIAVWAVAGVILHDAVFAPVCVALGFAGRRILPRSWWAPVMVAALCTVVVVLLAIPVYDKPGLRLDNPSALDRDYHWGLWVSLAVVWGATLLYLVGSRLLPVRQNQVVQQQGASRVDAKPPSV